MVAMPLKQQVIDYVDQLDDDRAEMVLVFAKTLAGASPVLQNTKTYSERINAAKAIAELERLNFSPKTKISIDGRTERAEHLWKKYESLS